MYKVLKNGETLALSENLTYVKLQDNGAYTLTSSDDAEGVVINGDVYSLSDKLKGVDSVTIKEVDNGDYASTLAVLLGEVVTPAVAAQFRKAIQLFAASLSDESAMEVASVYDAYQTDHFYNVGDYFTYGVNSVGDPQLYKVIQGHTSQEDWKPDTLPALYTAVGITDSGYPEWSQPTGASDAYNKDDIVSYNGTLYRSLIDSNVWSPDAYPAGWEAE